MFQCRPGTCDRRRDAKLRAIAASLPVLAIVSPVAIQTAAHAQTDSITETRCDIGHTNSIQDNLQTPLTMVWQTTTSPVAKSPQSPLYSGGVVYYAFGKNIYAVRSNDGTTLWTYSGQAPFIAPPAISGDSLFIGCDDAHLYKLSLKDGSVTWSKSMGGPIRCSPTISSGDVYFGDENGDVYSVDAGTGNTVWSFDAGAAVSSPIAIGDQGQVFFTSADSKVFCLSGDTGHSLWQLDFEADLGATPVCFANGSLYVAADHDLYALNPIHGAPRWHVHLTAGMITAPVVGPDNVFVITDENKILGMNDHGGILWTADLGRATLAPPLLAGSTVVVTTDNGAIDAFDANTGTRVWDYVLQPAGTQTKPATVAIAGTPIYVDNTLYVLGDDGSLSAFRPQSLDQSGPVVYSVTPAPGTTVKADSLTFAANVVDAGSGIAPSSLSLSVDGKPVDAVAYEPSANGVRTTIDPLAVPGPNTPTLPYLKNGPHTAVLTIADWKGNKVTRTWGFSITGSTAKTATDQTQDDDDNQTAPPPPIPSTQPRSMGPPVPGMGGAGGNRAGAMGRGQGAQSGGNGSAQTGSGSANGNAGAGSAPAMPTAPPPPPM